MALSKRQKEQCENHDYDFSGLSAIILNCTLKRTGQLSHTEALLKVSEAIMHANGVKTEMLRPVDYQIAPGVYPDMTEHGFERDDWPSISEKVMSSDIVIVGTPIWLGEESSVCRLMIERLYSESGNLNEQGQYNTFFLLPQVLCA